MEISLADLANLNSNKNNEVDDIFGPTAPVPQAPSQVINGALPSAMPQDIAWLSSIENVLANTKISDESQSSKGTVSVPLSSLFTVLKQSVEDPSSAPKAKYIISKASYNFQCKRGFATLKGRFELRTFTNQWTPIPFFSTKLSVISAKIEKAKQEGQEKRKDKETTTFGVLSLGAAQSQGVLTNSPGHYTVEVEAALPYSTPRETGFGFAIPRAVENDLTCTFRASNLEVKVDPSLQMQQEERREVRDEEEKEDKDEDDGPNVGSPGSTLIRCIFPPTNFLSVNWTTKIQTEEVEEAREELPLTITVEQYTLHAIGEGVINSQSHMIYTIQNAPVSLLLVAIQPGIRILGVQGSGVKKWEVIDPSANSPRTLKIFLDHGVENKYECDIISELELAESSCEVNMPTFAALGDDIKREIGHIGIQAITNVEVQYVGGRGLAMIDRSELSRHIRKSGDGEIILAYKFLDPAFALRLLVKKHQDLDVLIAVIEKAHIIVVVTEEGRILTKLISQIRNTQKQFLKIALPRGADIWSSVVSGRSVKPAKDKDGILMIPLDKSRVQSGTSEAKHSEFNVELVYLLNPAAQNQQARRVRPADHDEEKGEEVEEGDRGALDWAPLRAMVGRGQLNFLFPTFDLPINALYVSLRLPSDFKYGEFTGDLKEAVNGFSPPYPPYPGAYNNNNNNNNNNNFANARMMQQVVSNSNVMSQMPAPQMQMLSIPSSAAPPAPGSSAIGVLPVNVDVPEQGLLFQFEQLLYPGTKALHLSVPYKQVQRKGCMKRRRVSSCAIL